MQPFPFGYALPYFPVQLHAPAAPASAPAAKPALVDDAGIENFDVCGKCGFGGELLCCDSCPKAFHLGCLPPSMRHIPEGQWACPHCLSRADRTLDEMRSQLESVELAPLLTDVDSPKSSLSLGRLLRTMEIDCTPAELAKVAAACTAYFRTPRSTSIPIHSGHSASFIALLMQFELIFSPKRLADLMQKASSGGTLAHAFALAATYRADKCKRCEKKQLFRFFCFFCGQRVDVRQFVDMRKLHQEFESSGMVSNIVRRVQRAACPTVEYPLIPPPLWGTELEQLRHQAIYNGLLYFYQCTLDEELFGKHGGDMLFLMRNVAAVAVPPIQELAVKMFFDMASRWKEINKRRARDVELEVLLHSMEGMHAITQLERSGNPVHQLTLDFPDLKMEQEDIARLFPDSTDTTEETSSQTGPDNESVVTEEQQREASAVQQLNATVRVATDDAEDEAKPVTTTADTPSFESISLQTESVLTLLDNATIRAVGVYRAPAATTAVASTPVSGKAAKTRKRRITISARPQKEVRRTRLSGDFSLAVLRDDIQKAINCYHVSDMMGFDPSLGQLPMTPQNHCSHCSSGNSKTAVKCSNCSAVLKSKVDYGALTDALVWCYVFADVGVLLQSKRNELAYLTGALNLLPLARCYQRIDELGHDFFKLQGYFLTHFVYVMSDWGQHPLPRHMFLEEIQFIVENMHQVIRMEEPELVGEFLQCLKIFQISEQSDPDIWKVMQYGMLYLIDTERRKGSKGVWANPQATFYDKYHRSYCAIIGLMDYTYSGRADEPCPQPNLFRLLSR